MRRGGFDLGGEERESDDGWLVIGGWWIGGGWGGVRLWLWGRGFSNVIG